MEIKKDHAFEKRENCGGRIQSQKKMIDTIFTKSRDGVSIIAYLQNIMNEDKRYLHIVDPTPIC